MLLTFANLPENKKDVGSKAYMLARMLQLGYPVPNGAILEEIPTDKEFAEVLEWWQTLGFAPLAVRSSARGEDSGDKSYAGQNTTFLNIKNEKELKSAIGKCFESSKKGPSVIYRKFFQQDDEASKMNVVLQVMVEPKYAGVYFSKNPTADENSKNAEEWLVESVEGLGEDLVSGKKTPSKFTTLQPSTDVPLKDITEWGEKIRTDFQFEVDMEWAYGRLGNNEEKFYVLQARPITTKNNRDLEKKFIADEMAQLKKSWNPETLFDGSTFQEWTGVVSPATFSLWQKVFSPQGAYDKALQMLGYRAFPTDLGMSDNSLLQKVFGRGHLVLSKIADIYFGPIPYKYHRYPRPHLKFDYQKLSISLIFKTPKIWWHMLSVGWDLSTKRQIWLNELKETLNEQKSRKEFFDIQRGFEKEDLETSLQTLKNITDHFSTYTLKAPMVLVTLIESTQQSLKSLLKGIIPDEDIDKTLELWMSSGFETITFQMQKEFREASLDSDKRPSFYKKFGHRGIGDLDLNHPRYIELGDSAFLRPEQVQSALKKNTQKESAEQLINSLKTYKKDIILKEWQLLSEMLFLREEFKMHYLKEYYLIRKILLRIGEITGLKENIFNLEINEILKQNFSQEKIQLFIQRKKLLKKISLPPLFQLKELEEILTNGGPKEGKKHFNAEALSPGLVYGEVRVVLDPDQVDTSLWPENVIVVTESTDPAWTGIFIKAKGLIVEKGGILSHAAIVAREMGLPAVGQLYQCHLIFKDGDKVWVDGNHGTITIR